MSSFEELEQYLTSNNPSKKRAVTANDLLQGLSDPNPVIRQNIAKALGKLGDKKAVDPLTKLLSDKDENVRSFATVALGEIGSDETFQILLPLLRDDSVNVRCSVINAFTMLKNPGVYEILVKMLSDPENEVVCQTAIALGEFGDKKAVTPLVDLLLKEVKFNTDADKRAAAAIGLGILGEERALEPLRKVYNDRFFIDSYGVDIKPIILNAINDIEQNVDDKG
jgi:HEAT repeat protein